MTSHRLVVLLALASAVWLPAWGQSVISVHSGVIHYSEGAVFLDNQPVERRFGKFEEIKEGAELRTQDGRAEILLTPAVFLRIGENSAIRMISNHLADTRVQLVSGSAVVDSMQAPPDPSSNASSSTSSNTVPKPAVTMIYRDYEVHIGQPGRYRFNSDPPELRVYAGEADVVRNGRTAVVGEAHVLAFSPALTARKLDRETQDDLDNWARTRSEAVSASNSQAADTADLSSVIDTWPDNSDAYGGGASPYYPPSYYPPNSYPLSGFPLTGYPLTVYPMDATLFGYGGFGGFYPFPLFYPGMLGYSRLGYGMPGYGRSAYGLSSAYSRFPAGSGYRSPMVNPLGRIGAARSGYRPPAIGPVRIGGAGAARPMAPVARAPIGRR